MTLHQLLLARYHELKIGIFPHFPLFAVNIDPTEFVYCEHIQAEDLYAPTIKSNQPIMP